VEDDWIRAPAVHAMVCRSGRKSNVVGLGRYGLTQSVRSG
jgi:hypothetical protein